ncbi:hypothetical protein BWQ96_01413 [Gracilariopsis chorda]|uniref:Uncharacterized protein n=1 Tax=Gracilariopsis chorda TaxID=448386 RepID=A0A2V3J4D7_9FLOR|nr:hypothetical protein BWQ96_01413 [Gracilariopsis chorda]|eukprot:PXF48857.1 hypothetical protein BWQ96_01413 [Gracilariopsis chorda]
MAIKLISRTPKKANFRLFALLFLAAICTLHCANAVDDEKCLRQPFIIDQDNQVNRRFLISKDAPTAKVLRNHTEWQHRVDPMIRLMKNIVNGIDQLRESGLSMCNLQEKDTAWVYTARIQARYLQIGDLSSSCHSQLSGADAVKGGLLSQHEVKTSMGVIGTGVQALYEAISNISESRQLKRWDNWAQSFPLRDWRIADQSQTCRMESFSAYRKNSSYFLRAVMTNHHVNKYVEDRKRQFVNEWIRDDYSESIKVIHPNHVDKQLMEGTTLLTEWGARAWISWHGEMQDDDNPAIRKATEQNTIEIDLAEDSIVPSNVALLALPMFMSLIPVAFVAELGALGTVLYVIFTDVVAVIPFLIKGIELLSTTQSHNSLVAYYAGDEKLADLQVWVAECRGTAKFKYIGLAFVIIALAAIVTGVLLEVQAMKYMQKRRGNSELPVAGPFGRAMFDSTAEGLLGTGFAEIWERYSIASFESERLGADKDTASEGEDTQESGSGWIRSTLKWISDHIHSSTNDGFHSEASTSERSRECDLEETDILNACAGVGKDGASSAERYQNEGKESFGGDGRDGNV